MDVCIDGFDNCYLLLLLQEDNNCLN